MFDEDHFYLVFIAGVVVAVVLLAWHPWSGSQVLEQARTAESALSRADATWTACLGPPTASPETPPATSARCYTAFADAVQAITWPDQTTKDAATKVAGDARSIAVSETSGTQPSTAQSIRLGTDRAQLSTSLSAAIASAGANSGANSGG